jgi:hypothetical protein
MRLLDRISHHKEKVVSLQTRLIVKFLYRKEEVQNNNKQLRVRNNLHRSSTKAYINNSMGMSIYKISLPVSKCIIHYTILGLVVRKITAMLIIHL